MMRLTDLPIHTLETATLPQTAQGVSTPEPRLIKAAHQFEASLMQELLKPLQEKGAMFEEDGDDSDGSTNALGDFAAESLGQALSEHGGFGIADQIIHQLSHRRDSKRNNAETGKLHDISTVHSAK